MPVPSEDNVGEFLVDLSKWQDKIAKGGEAFVAGVALAIHTKIVERTPVGEGPPRRKGRIPGALRRAWLVTKTSTGYTITNDKEYGPVVEFGWYPGVGPRTVATSEGIFSTQAPAGMVRLTLAELDLLVADVTTELDL